MKTTLAILLSATAVGAFQTARVTPRSSTALNNFLDGKGSRITVRDDEDAAMWFDDGTGGRVPSEPKKPAPKKPVKKEAKKGGFKFPWDK
mmetsp:Transcript_20900/g.35940  ORF Transcript_20900/g.35940 Transcript_20900/m.35940 type:complete len:90 (+) Transcript_20900:58-327(+)